MKDTVRGKPNASVHAGPAKTLSRSIAKCKEYMEEFVENACLFQSKPPPPPPTSSLYIIDFCSNGKSSSFRSEHVELFSHVFPNFDSEQNPLCIFIKVLDLIAILTMINIGAGAPKS